MNLRAILLLSFSLYAGFNQLLAASDPLPLNIRPMANVDEYGLINSFSLEFENPNDKSVYCKSAYMQAFIGPDSSPDECRREFYELKTINIGAFELGPKGNSSAVWSSKEPVGQNELASFRSSRPDITNVEYCAREMPVLDCGFVCGNGKKYDESWDDQGVWGTVKVSCTRQGTYQYSNLKCSDKHVPNADGSGCIPLVCSAGYEPEGSACVPLKCTNPDGQIIPAGGTWTATYDIFKSHQTYVCQLGKLEKAGEPFCMAGYPVGGWGNLFGTPVFKCTKQAVRRVCLNSHPLGFGMLGGFIQYHDYTWSVASGTNMPCSETYSPQDWVNRCKAEGVSDKQICPDRVPSL